MIERNQVLIRSNALKKLIFLLLCTLSLPTKAERWFDVEVIVFKRNQDPASVTEKWPETQPNINLSNAVSVFDATSLQAQGLTLLPQSQWKLNSEYQKLANHAALSLWFMWHGAKTMVVVA
nr:CsiV family protein [Enterovibrio coralii]